MNPFRSRTSDRQLDDVLRHLDPAETSTAVDSGRDERARAVLQRVMATPVARAVAPDDLRGHGGRPRSARRAATVAGLAAALAIGSVAAPRLLGGGQALAWSATPQTLSRAQAAEAEAACDEQVRDTAERFADHDDGSDLFGLRPVITELRGSLVLVYETDGRPAPSEVTCYVRDGRVVGAAGSAATAASSPLVVAADSLHGELGGVHSTPSGSIRGVTGRVGTDVVGVVLDSVAQGPVTATVREGHFAAWWPDAPTSEAKENSATAPEITGATVTLRDGSTRQVTVEELSGRTAAELGSPDTGGSATS